MAHVTLIRPPTVQAKWGHSTPTCPPLGVAYVAAAVRAAGHRVVVVDAVGEGIAKFLPLPNGRLLVHGLTADEIAERISRNTEFIGISCMFSHEWPLMRAVIGRVRAAFPRVPIIGGGEHVTALPEFSLSECPALDYCVLGEGEETFVELIDALTSGKSVREVGGIMGRDGNGVYRTPSRPRIRQLNDIAPPAWDLVPLRHYLDNELGFGVNRGRSIPVLATRGCPYQCTFCSNPVMWTTRWLARDPTKVLEEMTGYIERYQVENFDFYDLTAIVKREWIVEFCQLILASGLKFTWQLPSGTRSEAIDEEVSRLLYESGCRNVSYAPESGSPAVLKRIRKQVKLERMTQSMRAAIGAGINVKANIILGFPDETHREVWQTMRFIAAMAGVGVHDISISPFSPYPGSHLFEELRKHGKIGTLSDAYFEALASYTDLSTTVSVAGHINHRALALYRVVGLLFFYGLSYAIRPWRLFRTIRNAFRDRQESRGEMWVRETIFRLRNTRPSRASAGAED